MGKVGGGHATSPSLGQVCNAALEDVMIKDEVEGRGRAAGDGGGIEGQGSGGGGIQKGKLGCGARGERKGE